MLGGGKGPPPFEWLLSRACEEFGCLPKALEGEDFETVMTIMELRSYARAKAAIDRAKSEADAPEWAVAMVFDVQAEIYERQKAAAEGQ